VTYLLNQARTHGASYKYDPYGRLIASSGGLASANLMRFSSKPWHDHSETYYYGYRFYLPEGQRWVNRDPIEEEGGVNLYRYVSNDPANWLDPDGLKDYCCKDFESQWVMPPQGGLLRRVPLFGRRAACDAAKMACIARCGEKYGSGNLEMMEGDNKECQDKCDADCEDNWKKCTFGLPKKPKPPRSPGDRPPKEQ
jgi:RHS repeat-associated protein